MKAPKTNNVSKQSRVPSQECRLQQRGAKKDPYKDAYMAGARAGTEVAWDLMMGALEKMARTLGIKQGVEERKWREVEWYSREHDRWYSCNGHRAPVDRPLRRVEVVERRTVLEPRKASSHNAADQQQAGGRAS